MDIVLLNAILYPVTALFFFYKFKRINIYVLFWIFLSFLSFMSYLTVEMGIYVYNPNRNIGYQLSLPCYILYYISNFIISWPLYSIKEEKLEINTNITNKGYRYFIYVSLAIMFAYTLLRASEAITISAMGYDVAYDLRHYSGKKVFSYNNFLLYRLDMQGGIFCSLSQPFVLMYFMNKLINKKGHIWINLFFVGFSFMPSFMAELARGSKGGIFFVVTSAGFFYILFAKLLSWKIKHIINICSVVVVLLLFSYAFAIQVARSGDEQRAYDTSIRYLGEPMLNLGDDVWERVKENPCGARLFPEFFDTHSFKSEDDRFNFWTKKTGITEAKFTTSWGDYYIEFGIIGGMIVLFVFTFLWRQLLFRRYWKFNMIPLIYYYFNQICIIGAFDWNLYNPWTKFLLLINILFCLYVGKIGKPSIRKYKR